MTDLITVQFTEREARALQHSAELVRQWVEELCPDYEQHLENGTPHALATATLALETALMLV
jgi:predicted DNA-binding transcriptional regulator YafY